MSAPDVVMTICPPCAVVASKALMVEVGLTPKKSFETTLNGAARFAELILTLPVTVTGKVSLVATGDAASVPPTKVVFGSTVSVNVTPVAVSPLAPTTTVYFIVSPGSALPSTLLGVATSASVFVAVTVGAKGATKAGLVRAEGSNFAASELGLEFFVTWRLGVGVVGWAFRSPPALLDSTETEKAIAAINAMAAIIMGATERFGLVA